MRHRETAIKVPVANTRRNWRSLTIRGVEDTVRVAGVVPEGTVCGVDVGLVGIIVGAGVGVGVGVDVDVGVGPVGIVVDGDVEVADGVGGSGKGMPKISTKLEKLL
jgi:hypothetical protein